MVQQRFLYSCTRGKLDIMEFLYVNEYIKGFNINIYEDVNWSLSFKIMSISDDKINNFYYKLIYITKAFKLSPLIDLDKPYEYIDTSLNSLIDEPEM